MARPRFLDEVCPGVDCRGVCFQAMEEAVKRVPEGERKASFEPRLQKTRARVQILMVGAGTHGGMPKGGQ